MSNVRLKFCTFLVLLSNLSVSSLMADGDKCHKSTEGTEFWFGFMESRNYSGYHYLEITVTAREACNFSIFIGPSGTPYNGQYSVAANSSVQVKIDWKSAEATESEKIQDRGIHLVADKPVNVYALNYDRNSADVAVIYPVESLGNQYFAMCYTPYVSETNMGTYQDGRNSEFLVVAVRDTTTIQITPSVVTDSLKPANTPFTVTLNRGQVYQVQSNNHKNQPGQGDLTGSFISADKPIAFYSGSLSTTVPAGSCCWDHLYEQIPPVHSWGREFYTVPLMSRQSDRYRVMAAENNTTVYIDGMAPVSLNRGAYYEFLLYNDQPKRIYADKPVLVAQFSQSRDEDKNYTGGNGDPFMIILSPSSQSKNDVTFIAYESSQIKVYFVNIVTSTSEIGNILLDGNSAGSFFKPFASGGFSYAQIPVAKGTHRILNSNPEEGFLAYVYGFGGVESYGYGVGFNLDLVLDLGKSINFNGDTLLLCYGDTVTLDAGNYFDTYDWNTGDSTQRLAVTKEGKYAVTTTTNEGCLLHDSIYIYMSHPEVSLGADQDSCPPYSIALDAGDGFFKYLWNTNDTTSCIIADKTGSYSVTVYDKYKCTAKDTMLLTVYPAPTVKIIGDSLVCGAKSADLEAVLSGADPSVWNFSGSIAWSSDNSGIIFSDPGKTSTRINVNDWGEYKINFSVKTIDGCESAGQFKIGFFEIPTSKFDFPDDSGNKCKDYYKRITYVGNASSEGHFYWNFGGSHVIDTLGWQDYYVSLGTYNTSPLVSLYVEDHGCLSDTMQTTIGANPTFQLETEKSRGCDSAIISFYGTLIETDSLLFEWDFGDGSAINNLQNPQHKYTQAGFYDVGLSITNLLSGCRIAYTLDDFIKIFPTPVADFLADPAECYPDSLKAVYLNSIDSSVCYWSFDGAHQSGQGNELVTVVLDSAIALVHLKVNEYGCPSDTSTKIVKRKPRFDFKVDNTEGCQPYNPEITAFPADKFLDFTWITDTLPYLSGSQAIYCFPDTGRFDITLAAFSSETQCSDTLKKEKWIWVHPKPRADFSVDFPVATIEHPEISFANHSVSGENYFWDFGDGNTSELENPRNTYSSLGDYIASLIAETGYGCTDTAFTLIKILPFSVYTPNAFRPDSDIPENKEFMPVGIGANPGRFNLKIYNRWGELVFESDSPEKKWDGKKTNGNNAPTGNYVWISDYFDIQGFEHHQKGQVLLIR